MSLAPLFDDGWIVTLHAFAALAAFLGALSQFALAKGTTLHRVTGRVWVVLMATVALSSFLIHDLRQIGPFSLIHLLSVYVLVSLAIGTQQARRGDIDKHRKTMRSMFWLGLVLAGAFTLIPGRTMHSVIFGG